MQDTLIREDRAQIVVLWFAERAMNFHRNAPPAAVRRAHESLQGGIPCAGRTCPICYDYCVACGSRFDGRATSLCPCH